VQFTTGRITFPLAPSGSNVKQQPEPDLPLTDRFDDLAWMPPTSHRHRRRNLQANLAYVHESRHLDASGAAEASGDLDSMRG